ncbi:hypothetical protein pdam_00009482 [Pocillopora damicornis]|uniref:Uncharacterized protein n=1 Tax=Pocillopora damicornis TaxID=46731 RepID=A0A3M6TGG8_POCDA|nr:hypothetical protein pdam_00009482 [Pocillopora damicornis]
MGSAVSVGKSSDARGKSLVTQLRQENVRLQARVDRLCVEGKRLNEEINTILKEREKEEEDLRIKCERFIHHSPTNETNSKEALSVATDAVAISPELYSRLHQKYEGQPSSQKKNHLINSCYIKL